MQPHKEHRPRKQNALNAMRDASRLPQPSIVDIDPEDPAQLLDDAGQFSVIDVELEVEAQPEAEAEADMDLAAIEAEGDETEVDDNAPPIETPAETTADAYAADADDTGDLYGVHQPPAEDRNPELTADTEQFVDADLGENWLETLGKRAAESGAPAEHDVDVLDDSDEHAGHHSTESGDRPVADKGSGGKGGL